MPSDVARPLRPRLVWPFVTSAIIQLVLVFGDRMPSIDATAYFEAGNNLLRGDGFVRQGAPELHFPPVAPVGYAALQWLTGSEMAALRTWHLLSGMALVALLTALARRLSRDDDVTVAVAWLSTGVIGLVTLSIRGGSGSELATVDLLLGATLCLLHATDRSDQLRRTVVSLGGAGALVGLAYLLRPEALITGLTLALGLAVAIARGPAGAHRRHLALGGAAFVVLAALAVGPYLAYLHGNTGSWAPTAKTKDASIEAWHAVARGDRLERDRTLYAINAEGTGIGVPTRSLTSLARDDPGGYAAIVATNATRTATFLVIWQLIPLVLLVPAIGQLWATRRRPATMLLAAVAAGPVVTSLAFFALPRYLMLTIAVLVPFGAWGIVEWLRPHPERRRAVWVGVSAFVAISFAISAWPLMPGSSMAERTEQRTAGEWIAANTPEDARIMTRSFHVQAYADRPVVALPYGELDEVLAFARDHGVQYLVADEATIDGRRPQLVEPLLGDTTPEGLELVHEFTDRGRTVRIYALEPPPPASTLPAIPLGFVGD